jgi:hypothetical protein
MSDSLDIEMAIESIADNRIISALDDYDPTTSYLFEQGVESIVDSRIDNLDMDALGIQEYINEGVGEAVTEGLRAHLFSSDDVEDFDSAVLSILQDEIDRAGPVDAPDNSGIERRVNDLEIQVTSLLETNQRLLSVLSGRVNDLEIQVDVPTFPPYAAAGI